MSRVYVCGDTHGRYDLHKLTTKAWPEQKELTKEDFLVILGDAGLIWSTNVKNDDELDLLKWCDASRYTTLFLPGNHENYGRLFSDEFPEVQLLRGKVKQISHTVFMLQRGHIYEVAGQTLFTMGGGFSIDKNRRSNRISWWEEEMPSTGEYLKAFQNLKEKDNKVDFILTHSCSNQSFGKLSEKMDFSHKIEGEESLRSFFDEIEETIEFREWHFGHFHEDLVLDNKHFLHYNSVPRQII